MIFLQTSKLATFSQKVKKKADRHIAVSPFQILSDTPYFLKYLL